MLIAQDMLIPRMLIVRINCTIYITTVSKSLKFVQIGFSLVLDR